MGSYSSLSIGELELSSAKNYSGGHGWLFEPENRKTEQFEDDDSFLYPYFSVKLSQIKEKLELSGFSLKAAETLNPYWNEYNDSSDEQFQLVVEALKRIDISKVRRHERRDSSASFCEYRVGDNELQELVDTYKINPFDCVDPYSLLRLFLENPKNGDQLVKWRYFDVVDGSWESECEIDAQVGATPIEYLVITEGSSDTFIIRKAIDLLRPKLTKFFRFIDMTDNYPFTGTGNLYRFCQGLSKIGIKNNVVVIYDNDTEGIANYQKTLELDLPENIRVITLPNIDEFENFPTIGPTGRFLEDINGKAVSIEMFLDLTFQTNDAATIRWTSFHQGMKTYHGSLENKEIYVQKFKSVKSLNCKYNFSKLNRLLDHLYEACVALATSSKMFRL